MCIRDRGQGGFGGNRTGAGRPGQRDGAPRSFDTPIQTKPSSNRQVKGAYKNDKYDKNKRVEDGPRSRNTKISKHPFIMPQKTAEEKVEEVVKVITLPEVLTIKELAEKMKLQPDVYKRQMWRKPGTGICGLILIRRAASLWMTARSSAGS